MQRTGSFHGCSASAEANVGSGTIVQEWQSLHQGVFTIWTSLIAREDVVLQWLFQGLLKMLYNRALKKN